MNAIFKKYFLLELLIAVGNFCHCQTEVTQYRMIGMRRDWYTEGYGWEPQDSSRYYTSEPHNAAVPSLPKFLTYFDFVTDFQAYVEMVSNYFDADSTVEYMLTGFPEYWYKTEVYRNIFERNNLKFRYNIICDDNSCEDTIWSATYYYTPSGYLMAEVNSSDLAVNDSTFYRYDLNRIIAYEYYDFDYDIDSLALIYNSTYTYYNDGEIKSERHFERDYGNQMVEYSRAEYIRQNNLLTDYFHWGLWIDTYDTIEHYQYEYSGNKLQSLIQYQRSFSPGVYWDSSEMHVYHYSENGLVDTTHFYIWNETAGWVLSSDSIFRYYPDGNLSDKLQYYPVADDYSGIHYEYTSFDKPSLVYYYDGEYPNDVNIWQRDTLIYDEHQNLVFTEGDYVSGGEIYPDTRFYYYYQPYELAIAGPANETFWLNVYPSPAQDIFYILIGDIDPDQEVTVEIFDLFGRLIFDITDKAGNTYRMPVFCSNYTPGVYFIRVTDGLQFATQKIVIR